MGIEAQPSQKNRDLLTNITPSEQITDDDRKFLQRLNHERNNVQNNIHPWNIDQIKTFAYGKNPDQLVFNIHRSLCQGCRDAYNYYRESSFQADDVSEYKSIQGEQKNNGLKSITDVVRRLLKRFL